jgi:hexosaminidase
MSMVKLNVFHWHITDSQSWPLDLSGFPELARAGAYSLSRKYTEDDIQGLVQYAGEVSFTCAPSDIRLTSTREE